MTTADIFFTPLGPDVHLTHDPEWAQREADEMVARLPRCEKCGLIEIQGHVCGPSVAAVLERSRKKSYLTTAQFARLNHACMIVKESLGDAPYLVGSSTLTAHFRDVDVRSIMHDDEFDAMFKGRPLFWSLFCLGVSTYLSEVSGLPVDYQVQRQTEANEKFKQADGHSRNPMGMAAREFAGGGDWK